MKRYLSIKEFSQLSGVETTTLRYWDEIGLFCPVRRNPETNYRYYTPQQVIAVNFVAVMSNLNVPLRTINDLLSVRDPETVIDVIERQERRLNMEMHRLRESFTIIQTRRNLIRMGARAKPNEISLVELPESAYVLGSPNDFKADEPFYEPFMRFCQNADGLRINLNYPIGGCHDSMESFLGSPGQPDYFFSVDPTGNAKQPAGTYMVGYSSGYYGEFGDLPEKMAAFAEERELDCCGIVYAVYLLDEICIKDPDQYLAQVCVAVSPKHMLPEGFCD
ncbi:MAG: MerR family transcriptional regulator [Oscillospiraceae bacterium]|nr:MerR family transcriptional regulator [Oscillospiraceae bacterium]